MTNAYKKLNCWINSIELAVRIYKISEDFPRDEHFNIRSQIRKAVVSISSNIAEGSGVGTFKNQLNYLHIAVGSCNEVESLLNIARRLGYIDELAFENIEKSIAESRRPVYGLIKHIKAKHNIPD